MPNIHAVSWPTVFIDLLLEISDWPSMNRSRLREQCLTILNNRCKTLAQLKQTHAVLLTSDNLPPSDSPLSSTTFHLSRLILASLPLSPSYSSLLFLHSPSPPNSFIFNSLIRFFSIPDPSLSLSFFLSMLRSASITPDHHTFPFVLISCANAPDFPLGFQVHTLTFKSGFGSDPYIQTALLRFYANTGENGPVLAHKVFDEIITKDCVHHDVLMNAYLKHKLPNLAIRVFENCAVPDKHLVTTALTACANSGFLDKGIWIHNKFLNNESILRDSFVASALINMYTKCGSITDAKRLFESLPARDNYTWSAMVNGFAMHGLATEAIGCLEQMEKEGVRPDSVVILGVLAACSHSGLVKEGLLIFSEMESTYNVAPKHEHYSCVVDMLCRVGKLNEALGLIREMPMIPLSSVWGSLLTGCRIYRNVELAEVAVSKLQKLGEEGDDEGVYVQMSNIYMDVNKVEEARRTRKMIGRRGVKKVAACSSIDVDGNVSSFVSGDRSHWRSAEIGFIVEFLNENITGDFDEEIDQIVRNEV